LCGDTIVSEQDGMIEDLDVIVEPAPTWRDRWLLPAIGAVAVGAVLAFTFVRLGPVRAPAPAAAAVSRPSVLQTVPLAAGIRVLELPRIVASRQARTQTSGVTGLTRMDMSEGFRDLYRLADGRLLIVAEYPDPLRSEVWPPVNALQPTHRVAVRGAMGVGYETATATLPMAIAWSSDAMQYVVGGAAFSEEELVGLAAQLR
jgi:hypothetical protein